MSNVDLAKIDLQYQQSRKCQVTQVPVARVERPGAMAAPLNESNAASKADTVAAEA